MRILFLDQSGKLGGAELSLLDLAASFREQCCVGLFQDGPFRERLEQAEVPVEVLGQRSLQVQKSSGFVQGLFGSGAALIPLIRQVLRLSRDYDVIYTNTQKAFVVGAFVSALNRKPLVHHQRDILSTEHFSPTNLRLLVGLANRFATRVIANSKATQAAFVAAGGNAAKVDVVYNGFDAAKYGCSEDERQAMRRSLNLRDDQFVVGHFSRLSPWKGQHVLIEALQQCPDTVVALLVGDALFGEDDYAESLHQQVKALDLEDRVHFLGFRSEIPQLMTACDVVAHTSTAPEPFGRVIIEAMLCGKPAIAAAAGGAVELVEHAKTGWLLTPGDCQALSHCLREIVGDRAHVEACGRRAIFQARQRFSLEGTVSQISQILATLCSKKAAKNLDNSACAKQ